VHEPDQGADRCSEGIPWRCFSIVDTVSSFSVLPVPMDELGIDVMLTGSQKALALPPGMALFSVSEKAMKRAEQVTRPRLLLRFP